MRTLMFTTITLNLSYRSSILMNVKCRTDKHRQEKQKQQYANKTPLLATLLFQSNINRL